MNNIDIIKAIAERRNRERLMARVDKRNAIDEQLNIFTRFMDKKLRIREPVYITYLSVEAETDKGIAFKFPNISGQKWFPKSYVKVNFHTRTLVTSKSLAQDREIDHLATQGAQKMNE